MFILWSNLNLIIIFFCLHCFCRLVERVSVFQVCCFRFKISPSLPPRHCLTGEWSLPSSWALPGNVNKCLLSDQSPPVCPGKRSTARRPSLWISTETWRWRERGRRWSQTSARSQVYPPWLSVSSRDSFFNNSPSFTTIFRSDLQSDCKVSICDVSYIRCMLCMFTACLCWDWK